MEMITPFSVGKTCLEESSGKTSFLKNLQASHFLLCSGLMVSSAMTIEKEHRSNIHRQHRSLHFEAQRFFFAGFKEGNCGQLEHISYSLLPEQLTTMVFSIHFLHIFY